MGYTYDGDDWNNIYIESWRDTYYSPDIGEYINRISGFVNIKKEKEPELQTGDTAVLDDFLGGFVNA